MRRRSLIRRPCPIPPILYRLGLAIRIQLRQAIVLDIDILHDRRLETRVLEVGIGPIERTNEHGLEAYPVVGALDVAGAFLDDPVGRIPLGRLEGFFGGAFGKQERGSVGSEGPESRVGPDVECGVV